MKLSGQQLEQLHNALLSSFRTLSGFEQLAQFGLDENLSNITVGRNLREIAFDLIQWSQAHNRLFDLLDAAENLNSGNQLLQQFSIQYRAQRWQTAKQIQDVQVASTKPELADTQIRIDYASTQDEPTKDKQAQPRLRKPLSNGVLVEQLVAQFAKGTAIFNEFKSFSTRTIARGKYGIAIPTFGRLEINHKYISAFLIWLEENRRGKPKIKREIVLVCEPTIESKIREKSSSTNFLRAGNKVEFMLYGQQFLLHGKIITTDYAPSPRNSKDRGEHIIFNDLHIQLEIYQK